MCGKSVPHVAGIAHNKILAKLASGMHKPAQQTVVTLECVPGLMAELPIPKLRQLGGKFGEEVMAALGISTVGALLFALDICRAEKCMLERQGLMHAETIAVPQLLSPVTSTLACKRLGEGSSQIQVLKD